MLRVVFFDAAGTLFHTREPAGLSYAKIARRYGLVADDRIVIDSFKRAFAAAPGLAFGPGHDPADLRRMEREWWNRLVRATFAKVGVLGDFAVGREGIIVEISDGRLAGQSRHETVQIGQIQGVGGKEHIDVPYPMQRKLLAEPMRRGGQTPLHPARREFEDRPAMAAAADERFQHGFTRSAVVRLKGENVELGGHVAAIIHGAGGGVKMGTRIWNRR